MRLGTVALLLALAACDNTPKRRPPENVQDTRMVSWADQYGGIAVFHDDRRNVTCWSSSNGLACIPDIVLVDQEHMLAYRDAGPR